MKIKLLAIAMVLMIATTFTPQSARAASFGDDVAFLKDHTEVIVLSNKQARVAVVPAWQGRVMTSTAERDGGQSFGWINRELIAAEKILVTREIDNTATEARAVADLMKTHGWKRVILVTTGWHMPRAAYLFKRAGVACTLFPVDFRFDRTHPVAAIDFVPKAEALMLTETALREIYGNLFYRLFR